MYTKIELRATLNAQLDRLGFKRKDYREVVLDQQSGSLRKLYLAKIEKASGEPFSWMPVDASYRMNDEHDAIAYHEARKRMRGITVITIGNHPQDVATVDYENKTYTIKGDK